MANENLVPTYLAEIFNRAVPDPLDDNSPFQGFASPIDGVTVADSVASLGLVSPPSLYEVAMYGRGAYQSRADLTYSGRVLVDAYRALGLDGDGLATPGGIGVWESTTNLHPNGGCETNTTGWGATPTATVSRDNTHAMFGSWSLKIVTNGVSTNEGSQVSGGTVAVTPGATYAASMWVYSTAGGEIVYLNVDENDANGHFLVSWPKNAVTLQAGWNYLQSVQTVGFNGTYHDASVATIGASLRTITNVQAITVWQDGVQIEQRRAATNVTASGNEITDAVRLAALSWASNHQGGQVDQYGWSVVNWVTNPNFKTAITGWNIFGGAGITGGSASWNSTGGIGGTGCGQYSGTGGASNSYCAFQSVTATSLTTLQAQAMPCTSGQTIRARASLQLNACSSGSPSLDLYVYFYDSTGTVIGSPVQAATQASPTLGTWYSMSGTVIAPANAAYVFVRAQCGGNTQIANGATFTVLIDNAQICDNTLDPGSYVDGDSISSAKGAYSWWGTSEAAATRLFAGDSSYYLDRAATNLFQRGQCDAQSPGTNGWNNGGSGGTMTCAVDTATPAPFSPQSMKITVDGSNNNQGVYASAAGSWAAGTTMTGSIWFKGVSGKVYKYVINYYNGTTEKAGTSTSFTATGQWQLLVPVMNTVQTGDTATAIRLYVQTTTAVADTFWVAHAMEEASVTDAAPYVATSGGATATNSVSSITGPSSLFNSDQGWVALRVRVPWAYNAAPNNYPSLFRWWDGSTANKIVCYYTASLSKWVIEIDQTGGNTSVSAVQSFAAGSTLTLIFAWNWTAQTVSISVNGGAFSSNPWTHRLTASAMQATFSLLCGDTLANMNVLWAMGGTGTLTNTDAATLNTLGNTDPDPDATFGATQATTFVWTADNASWLMPGAAANVPTPYVETNGSSASRAAARVQAPGTLLNPQQGWYAARVRMPFSASQMPRGYKQTGGGNPWQWVFRILLQTTPRESIDSVLLSNGSGYTLDMESWVAGAGTTIAQNMPAFNVGDTVTMIGYWTATTIAVSINGAAFTTRARSVYSTLPMPSTFDIGSNAGGNTSDLDFLWFACGTGTLANADITYLSGLPGSASSPPFQSSLTSGAHCTGIVYAPIATPILLTYP